MRTSSKSKSKWHATTVWQSTAGAAGMAWSGPQSLPWPMVLPLLTALRWLMVGMTASMSMGPSCRWKASSTGHDHRRPGALTVPAGSDRFRPVPTPGRPKCLESIVAPGLTSSTRKWPSLWCRSVPSESWRRSRRPDPPVRIGLRTPIRRQWPRPQRCRRLPQRADRGRHQPRCEPMAVAPPNRSDPGVRRTAPRRRRRHREWR